VLAFLLVVACHGSWDADPAPAPSEQVAAIDPFIATGGGGFLVGSATPAATVPFGLVKLGPDTALEWGGLDAYHCSGYYWDDTHVDGFSHLHMHGVGIPDYGAILVMPLDVAEDLPPTGPDEWRTTFSKENESARAGFYQVTLDNGITAELTATTWMGAHRYTFPDDADPVLAFDLDHVLGGDSAGAEVHLDPVTGTLWGVTYNSGGFTTALPVYFHAQVVGGFSDWGLRGDGVEVPGGLELAGLDRVGAWLRPNAGPVELRVGISGVSVENARAHVEEAESLSFSQVAWAAQEAWEEPIGRFELLGATAEEQTIFYTAVYHLLQMPTRWTDSNGQYPGFDGEAHTAYGFVYHSEFSLWDTYRTAHPAYNLFYPEKARDFAISLLTMAQEGGAFPRWPAGTWEGGSMLGAPADIVLAETWLKGIRDWDMDAAWPLLRAQARGEGSYAYNARPDPSLVQTYGYYPSDLIGGSVAWTQELAWADHALAGLAGALGEADEGAFFEWRSYSYQNQWDPEVGFFHARRSDGTFEELDNPLGWEDEYVEGNAWQYLWMPFPHAEHTATLLGGREAAIARLDTFMEGARAEGLIPGPAAYYWHGNEPDIHAPFLYALWGDRDRTYQWQRWVEDNRYSAEPAGLAGNDDAGTLSAWYIFSTLGLYPIAGTDRYVVAVPRFPAARFAVDGGWFTVVRRGVGPHVARVLLDDVELTRSTLHHSELTAGRVLVVELTE